MKKEIVSGVYPTMLTPFNNDGTIDDASLERLITWYGKKGIDGLFAVCQSSAMFELSKKERKELCKKTVKYAAGEYPVMASGHVSDTLDDQIEDLIDMADAGADALVLVSNRLASPDESDSVWLYNLEKIIARLPPDIPLGVYECPYPYKRLLSEKIIKEMIGTGRFMFVKDTCCRPDLIAIRAKLAEGSKLKFFNANAATLLYSLKKGYAGYSGIMTNFHPELYFKLCHDWSKMGADADELQNYIGLASVIEYQSYPVNAKYSLVREGIFSTAVCRRSDARYKVLTPSQVYEVDEFRALSQSMCRRFIK
jgi:4-hydroxy-tetrahydrodipicolinate synthase